MSRSHLVDACDRRAFLRTALCLGAGALVLRPRPAGAATTGLPSDGLLSIGFIGAPGAGGADAERGARLGAEEAAQALGLLGRRFAAHLAPAADAATAVAQATRLISSDGVFGLVGGFDPATARALGRLAEERGVLFLNAGCADDALRGAACGRTTFHVAASERMRRDALELWRREPATASGDSVAAAEWHPELDRFGAGQLNERFASRFGEPLRAPGWTSWMAVKVLWESAARARSTDAAALAAHLLGSRARFDGHKGMPLSFRPGDHQLRQPLYLVDAAGGALRGEVPRARRDEDRGWTELLDQLGGDGAGAAGCRGSAA